MPFQSVVSKEFEAQQKKRGYKKLFDIKSNEDIR